jgi:hypothetical protein
MFETAVDIKDIPLFSSFERSTAKQKEAKL